MPFKKRKFDTASLNTIDPETGQIYDIEGNTIGNTNDYDPTPSREEGLQKIRDSYTEELPDIGLTPEDVEDGYNITSNSTVEDLNNFRASKQGNLSKATNAIVGGLGSGVFTAIESLGYIVDVDNALGRVFDTQKIEDNWLSHWAKEQKKSIAEGLPIYEENEQGVINNFFKWNTLKGIIDSAVGFAIPGGIASKAIAGAQRATRANALLNLMKTSAPTAEAINSLATGAITNYAEGKMMGLELYENTINKLDTKLKEEALKQANREVGLTLPNKETGLSNNTARDQRAAEIYQDLATKNKAKFEKIAADEADKFQLRNTAFAITDAMAIGNIMKGANQTRRFLQPKNVGKSVRDAIIKQAPKESLEEISQNVLQKEGEYQAFEQASEDTRLDLRDKDAPDDIFNRTLEFATSEQALLEGLMGAVGGAPQSVFVKAVSGQYGKEAKNREQNIRDEQAAQLEANKDYVENKFYDATRARVLSEEAIRNGREDLELQAKEKLEDNVIIENLQRGTIEQFENSVQDVKDSDLSEEELQNKGWDEDYKDKAQGTLNRIKDLEKKWLDYTKYENQGQVFSNRVAKERNNDFYNINKESLNEAEQALKNEADKIALKYAERPGLIQKEDVVIESENFKKIPIDYSIDNIDNHSNSQFKNAVQATEEYKKYKQFQAEQEAILNRDTELENSYKEMTSFKAQKEYVNTQKEAFKKQEDLINSKQDEEELKKAEEIGTEEAYKEAEKNVITKDAKKEAQAKVKKEQVNKLKAKEAKEGIVSEFEIPETIEAKKAYIEKRRQKELDEITYTDEKDLKLQTKEKKVPEAVIETPENNQAVINNQATTMESSVEAAILKSIEEENAVNTGYTSKHYNEAKKGLNKVNEAVQSANRVTENVVEGEVKDYSRSKNSNKLSTKAFEFKEKKEGNVKTRETTSTELTKRTNPRIVDAEDLSAGTPMLFKIDANYGENEDDVVYKGEKGKETIHWNQFVDNLKKEYGDAYKNSQEYLENVPIIAVDENGNKLSWLHNTKWITDDNISATKAGMKDLQAQNRATRREVIEKGSFSTKVKANTPGVFIFNKKNNKDVEQPVSKAFPAKDLQIGIPTSDGLIVKKKEKFNGELINKGGQEGLTSGLLHAIVPVAKGVKAAVPLFNQVLNKESKRSLVNAVEMFHKNRLGQLTDSDKETINTIADIGGAVGLKMDITTPKGLQNYFNFFTYQVNPGQQSLEDFLKTKTVNSKTHSLNVTGQGDIDFIKSSDIKTDGENRVFGAGKDVNKLNKQIQSFEKFLDNVYWNANTEFVGQDINVPLINDTGVVSTKPYLEFAKENTFTNLLSINIGTEETPKYAYTVNRGIEFEPAQTIDKDYLTTTVEKETKKVKKASIFKRPSGALKMEDENMKEKSPADVGDNFFEDANKGNTPEQSIEEKRQEELYANLSSEDKEYIDKIKDKVDSNRLTKELKKKAGKTPEGNRLLDKYRAEDTINNPNSTPLEKATAKYSLAKELPFNSIQVSDMRKILNDETGKTYDEFKPYYDAEIAALESKQPTTSNTEAKKADIERRMREAINNITEKEADGFIYNTNYFQSKYEGFNFNDENKEKVIEQIIAKYAKLAALESEQIEDVVETPTISQEQKDADEALFNEINDLDLDVDFSPITYRRLSEESKDASKKC